MSETGRGDDTPDHLADAGGSSPRVAAAAIRDAIAALEAERPDLAVRLEALAAALEEDRRAT